MGAVVIHGAGHEPAAARLGSDLHASTHDTAIASFMALGYAAAGEGAVGSDIS